ncbi:MAG: hypothetical protein RR478_05550 [Bacilli bacterium]
MKKIISLDEFKESFKEMGRGNQFSNDGLEALYCYLLDCEAIYKCEIELDVIDLCCNFTEYENLDELKNDGYDIKNMEDLENKTNFAMIDDERFIIQNY